MFPELKAHKMSQMNGIFVLTHHATKDHLKALNAETGLVLQRLISSLQEILIYVRMVIRP